MVFALAALAALMQAPAAKAANSGAQPAGERERSYFTDTLLTDQFGNRNRFYSDILRSKTVLINFMFTGCSDACPLMTHRLRRAMAALKDDFGRQIEFVSITVDPLGDTLEELKRYAERFDIPEKGWRFLTGKPNDVTTVLQRLGERAKEKEVHTTLLLAGNVDTRHWRKIPPETAPHLIAASLRDLAGISSQ